jgi:predicted transcriptional regulator
MATSSDLSEPVSLRVPSDILQAIEAIAAATDRTRSWVMVRALKRYLATEGADVFAVAEGRRQIAAGDAHDVDAVIDEVETLATLGTATW